MKKPFTYYYLTGILLAAMIACSDPEDPVVDEGLLDVVWKVDTLQTPEEEIVPGPDTLMVLQFFNDTRVDADTPCNDYSGTYKINNNGSLEIVWHSWTEMACMGRPGTLEGRFVQAINNASVYDVSESTLTLSNNDSSYVVKLKHE